MLPPAPLRFSTMNCWPNRWLSACASTRAAMSPDAPAARLGLSRRGGGVWCGGGGGGVPGGGGVAGVGGGRKRRRAGVWASARERGGDDAVLSALNAAGGVGKKQLGGSGGKNSPRR